MNGIQNKKRMYDYCCQRIICHKEILSRIIQEYVEEAKKMTIKEISKHIYGIKMSSLEEFTQRKEIKIINKMYDVILI